MNEDFEPETCFTCCKKAIHFHNISDSDGDSKLNIRQTICQHFWFKEDDLRSAIVCEACWGKVDHFHQFYLDVKNLHEHREVTSLSMFIKQEEITIEETQLQENVIETSAENENLFDVADCKHEISEEFYELPKKEEPVEVFPKLRKKRRYPKRLQNQRKLPTPAERQAEDDFIKQHTRYICDECNIEFESFLAIKYHRINAHKKMVFVCCGNKYRARNTLYQHVQSLLNPEAFKCEICGKSFKSKDNYVRHKELNHAAKEDLVFKCNRCPKSFIKDRFLKNHTAEHETLENETDKCEFCGKCFRHKKLLNKHVRAVHKKPMDFICEVCSKGFYQRWMFLEHHKTHELTADQLKEQCPVCSKWLKNHLRWLEHMRRHKVGECKCEVCGHVSCNTIALQKHMKHMHAPDKKKHGCEQCGKEFTRVNGLKEHVANAHTREHLYQCLHCDKKFFSRANMYSHRNKDHPQEWLKHAPVRMSLVCEQCNKGYSRAIQLKEHVASAHTREHLYQCQHCEKKFFYMTDVYKHRKKDHPQEKLEDSVSKYARRERVSDGGETFS